MTWRLPRVRAAIAALVVVVLAVAGVRLAAGSADRTAASWADDVHASTTVELGSWAPRLGTCTAVKAGTLEPVPGRGCDVVAVSGSQVQDSRPVGQRWAQITIDIESSGGYTPDLLFLVEIDLSASAGAVRDWQYTGGWFAGDNLRPLASARCADLPVATMLFPEWTANAGTYVEIDLFEAGAAGGRQAACTR